MARPARESRRSPNTVYSNLLVRLPAETAPRAIWEAARNADEQIRAFRPRRSTLEEVFLDALGGDR